MVAMDLHACVADTIEELRHLHSARALNHERVGTGSCVADGDRLAQLLGNLVSNAMTYGLAEEPVTVVSMIEDTSFTLSVHNQGAPIPADIQAALFQPMTRGSSAGASARSVGLGLYIVSEIAKAHGGEVTVHSTEDEGTTFLATFPRKASSPA